MHSDSHPNSCHKTKQEQNKIYFIEKEMGQTRVKAGHIRLRVVPLFALFVVRDANENREKKMVKMDYS